MRAVISPGWDSYRQVDGMLDVRWCMPVQTVEDWFAACAKTGSWALFTAATASPVVAQGVFASVPRGCAASTSAIFVLHADGYLRRWAVSASGLTLGWSVFVGFGGNGVAYASSKVFVICGSDAAAVQSYDATTGALVALGGTRCGRAQMIASAGSAIAVWCDGGNFAILDSSINLLAIGRATASFDPILSAYSTLDAAVIFIGDARVARIIVGTGAVEIRGPFYDDLDRGLAPVIGTNIWMTPEIPPWFWSTSVSGVIPPFRFLPGGIVTTNDSVGSTPPAVARFPSPGPMPPTPGVGVLAMWDAAAFTRYDAFNALVSTQAGMVPPSGMSAKVHPVSGRLCIAAAGGDVWAVSASALSVIPCVPSGSAAPMPTAGLLGNRMVLQWRGPGVVGLDPLGRSDDGVTWTPYSGPFAVAGGYGQGMTSSSLYFVHAGERGPAQPGVSYSLDGVAWTNATIPDAGGGQTAGIAAYGLRVVLVGVTSGGQFRCQYSPDGGVTWANSNINGTALAVDLGPIFASPSGFYLYTAGKYQFSADGATWGALTVVAGLEAIIGIHDNGVLARFTGGVIKYSEAGSAWTNFGITQAADLCADLS